MGIGYTEERPKEKDYFDFQEKFTLGLEDLKLNGLSYLSYGSFPRGSAVYGRSDIDGLLVFPDEFVIDKENFRRVKEVYHVSKGKSKVPLQIQVMDMGNLRDGRFFSYEPQFVEVFEEFDTLVGMPLNRLIDEMTFLNFIDAKLMQAIPNLSALRKGFLRYNFDENDYSQSYLEFKKNFDKMLERTGRMATKFPHICFGRKCENERFLGINGLEKELDVDFEPLKKGKLLLNNPNQLDAIYYKPQEMLQLWEESLTLYEVLVKEYCTRVEVPNISP